MYFSLLFFSFFRVFILVIPPLPNVVFFQFGSDNMYDLCSKKREKSVHLFLTKCLIISSAFIYCKYRKNLFSVQLISGRHAIYIISAV